MSTAHIAQTFYETAFGPIYKGGKKVKLILHAFDFERNTLEFSVPPEIMATHGFGYVPGGVEVDLSAITGDASLGISEPKAASQNSESDAIMALVSAAVDTDGAHHKQWYLERVAQLLGRDLPGHEPGIEP